MVSSVSRFSASVAAAALLVSGVAAQSQINGAGATFPFPIYSKWFSEYNKLHPNVRDQLPVDRIRRRHPSGDQSDGVLRRDRRPDDARSRCRQRQGRSCTSRRCSAPSFRSTTSRTSPATCNFSGTVLADIFLGKITKWNDAAIGEAESRASTCLAATSRSRIERMDPARPTSGCDYLSKMSPEFKTKVGVNTSVNWPTGVGGRGNEGVAGLVKQTPGAIGYVELIYALQNKISAGSVQNMAGEHVKATVESVTAAAAEAAKQMPPDFRVSITNAPGKGVFPVSSLHLAAALREPQGQSPVQGDGGLPEVGADRRPEIRAELGYAPLPEAVVKLEVAALAEVKVS